MSNGMIFFCHSAAADDDDDDNDGDIICTSVTTSNAIKLNRFGFLIAIHSSQMVAWVTG